LSSRREILKNFLNGRGWFETHELVVIGLFAAGSRASSLILALIGGGMNPVTMILRSAVHSALLVTLLTKVPKTGVLTLANLVGALLAFLLMGQSMMTAPALFIGVVGVEIAMKASGGLEKRPGLAIPAIAVSELISRLINVGVAYLMLREDPSLSFMVAVISGFSYLGVLLGLFVGIKMTRELRHAGLIQN
jgi:energy-coupling factor transport system substrate-specific component